MEKNNCVFHDEVTSNQLHRAILDSARFQGSLAESNSKMTTLIEHMGNNVIRQNDELAMHNTNIGRLADVADKNYKNNKLLIYLSIVLMVIAFVAVGGGSVIETSINLYKSLRGL